MADKFDELMRGVAEQADSEVDYDAMKRAVLLAAAKQKTQTRLLYKKLSMAAALVVLVGVGMLAARSMGLGETNKTDESAASEESAVVTSDETDEAAPEAAAYMMEAPVGEAADEEAAEDAGLYGYAAEAPAAASGKAAPGENTEYDEAAVIEKLDALTAQSAGSACYIGESDADAETLSAALGAEVSIVEYSPEAIAPGDACAVYGEACWRLDAQRCAYITAELDAEALLALLDAAV